MFRKAISRLIGIAKNGWPRAPHVYEQRLNRPCGSHQTYGRYEGGSAPQSRRLIDRRLAPGEKAFPVGAVAGNRVALADLDSDSASLVDGRERKFVGHVVASANGQSSTERVLGEKGFYRGPLGHPVGPDLEHHLSRKDRQFGRALDRLGHGLGAKFTEFRPGPVMQRNRPNFPLKQQALMAADQGLKLGGNQGHGVRSFRIAMHDARPIAAHQTVLGGDGKLKRRKEAIDRVGRACQQRELSLGYFGTTADSVKDYARKGYHLICAGTDAGFVNAGAEQMLQDLRA